MLWKTTRDIGQVRLHGDKRGDKVRSADTVRHRDRRLIGQSEAHRQVLHTYRYAERQAERQRLVWFTSASFCCFVIWSAEPGGGKVVVARSDSHLRNSKTVKHSWNFKAVSCTELLFQPQHKANRLLKSLYMIFTYLISVFVKDLRHD